MITQTILLALLATTAAAQTPQFDVASIKENRSGSVDGGLRVQPGGRYVWTNTTLKGVIDSVFQRFAFDMREATGGPDWLDTARFDIVVQTGAGAPPVDPDGFPGQLFAMMQALLAERFGLRTHNEVREGPIYKLVLARRDGRLGDGIRKVAAGCAAAMKALSDGAQAAVRSRRGPDCTFGGPPGQLQGNAVTIDMFARVLGRHVQRLVVNETGLDGSFDLDLSFSPEFVAPPPGSQVPGAPPPAPSDGPSIFTAVQEQLGLELESTRGPVDVLVVDRAERPTEN